MPKKGKVLGETQIKEDFEEAFSSGTSIKYY